MARCKQKKIVSWLLAGMLALSSMPVLHASGEEEVPRVNLLAADMDNGFDGGTSPFTLDTTTSAGSQQIVQVNGNNALEIRDASAGASTPTGVSYRQTSGTLISRINEIYRMPVGSAPVDFVLAYKLLRSAASTSPVNKDIYAQIEFSPFDDNYSVPRFPMGAAASITGTAAYTNTVPNELKAVNDTDLPAYKFHIVPNGGQKQITTFRLSFSVRANTGGTDEAIVVDDLAVYELKPGAVIDAEAPTAPTNVAATATDTGASLSWTAATDNVGVTRYDVYQNGLLIAMVGGSAVSYAVTGLTPNTAYAYTVKARDAAGNASALSAEAAVTTATSHSGLPAPFGDLDIGAVRIAGGASYDAAADTYSVQASGADIWGTDDQLHYVYRPWQGDGQIVARVSGIQNGVAWTKAGIMIRQNMTSQSPHAMMAVSPANGVVFEDRLQQGGNSTLTSGTVSPAPYWIKLTRVGNVITAYDSGDGSLWTLVKRETVNLPETVYFGLALTSHDVNRLTTATYSNVSIGAVPPPSADYSPYPGTVETRREWLWNKSKTVAEEGGPLNIAQYTAQLYDNQNTALNLQKLDTLFQTYDAEQYKTVSKMYAYLLDGSKFSPTMLNHVKSYFTQYAYAQLPQTENLRMSNYAAGYLVGQYLPDVVDLNGKSGAELKSINRANIENMINAGVHKGWAEYESLEYSFMTYFCLNAIYQYTDEPDFKQKVKMAMDVMWFEWANDWINDAGTILSSTSRSKGDGSSASGPTWRGADHSALSWMYFGQNRAQQGIGESDTLVPAAYRPFLEYIGLVVAPSMTYSPPDMALAIGRDTSKDYASRKTNLQNSSGRGMKVYRQAFVKPTWGLATEVTYNRVDNWIENMQAVLRWQSPQPDALFRVNADQNGSAIGNYDQPESHRVMQDGSAAIAVFKSLGGANATDNYLNAMFPDTGSITTRQEQSGWVFNDTGSMYFAFKMIKPYTWYRQSTTDPGNKVKTNASTHPTASLYNDYNILRSRADKNGWVLETADASDYADFASFKNAVLTTTAVDSSHIDDTNPRLVYTSLSGDTMDLTFDQASGSYAGTHKINGTAIDYASFKLFDTPWLQQEQNSDLFTATRGGEQLTYDFANWTVTSSNDSGPVPVTGIALNSASLSLSAGQSANLIANFQPVNATNKAVAWTSSAPAVASVDATGKVTAAAPGTAVIFATTADGSFTASCTVTVAVQPLFQESFAGGLGSWDLFGSTAWTVTGSGTGAKLTGSTTLTGPQRAVVKSSALPYSTQDFSLSFDAASNRFRTMFRYSSSTSYYFLEFKDTKNVEMWKYPNSSTPSQVGATVDISAAIPGFDITEGHLYNLEAVGSQFTLTIDGVEAATFSDADLTSGGIGFALKSVGASVNLAVDQVTVMPVIPGGA